MDVFDLAAKIRLDSSEYEKELNALKGTIGTVGKVLAAGATAAGGAAVALTKQAVGSYAQYEQLVGGVETLFKDSADTVMRYADNAYKTSGLSANDYMQQTIMFSASLIQGLKGDTEAAADIANMAIVDMSDNVNKMGTSMEMVQNAYRGLARQNFTMLDNLSIGYQGTAAEMARLINDSGVMGDTFKATAENVKQVSFDKYIEAIHVIQTQMGISGLTAEEAAEQVANGVLTQEEAYEKLGTTAKEAKNTIEGSSKAVAASWQNIITGLANGNADIGSLIDIFLKNVETSAENLFPTIERAINGVVQLATGFIEKAPSLIQKFLPTIVSAISSLAKSIGKALPGLVRAGGTLISALVQGFLDNIDELIAAVGEVIAYILEELPEAIPKFFSTVTTIIEKISSVIIKNAPKILSSITKIITSLISTIATNAPKVIRAVISVVTTLIPLIAKEAPKIIKAIADALPELLKGLAEIVQAIVRELPTILNALLESAGEIIEIVMDAINDNMPLIIELLIGIVGAIIEQAPKILKALATHADKIIFALVDGIIMFLPQLVDGAIEIIDALVGFLSDNAEDITQGAIDLILKIVEVLSDPEILKDLLTAAGEIISALTKGIIKVIPDLFDSFLGAGRGIIGGFSDAFKSLASNIHRVGEYLFDQIMVGLGLKDAEEVGRKYANGVLTGAAGVTTTRSNMTSSGGGGNTFSGGGSSFSESSYSRPITLEIDKKTFGTVTYQQQKVASAIRGRTIVDVGLTY